MWQRCGLRVRVVSGVPRVVVVEERGGGDEKWRWRWSILACLARFGKRFLPSKRGAYFSLIILSIVSDMEFFFWSKVNEPGTP